MARRGGTMQLDRRGALAAGLAATLLVAACSGGEELASTTATSVPDSVAGTAAPTTQPAATAPASTAPSPTTPATTAPTATAAPSTAPASTSAPSDTTQPPDTTSPPATPPVPKPATAFAAAEDQLVEIDATTGATLRILEEFFSGDGVFRGGLRMSTDRATIWFSEGYEDNWYACETSVGSWGRIDAATGDMEVLGSGFGVEQSADGEYLSYLTSSLCLPDPTEPELFVLTPTDQVVVRQLSTGDERIFVTDTPPDNYDAPSAISGAVFDSDGSLLVQLGDGRLIDVDIDGSDVIQDHPVALDEILGFPWAATADALITLDFGVEGSSDVYSVDRESGAATLLASTEAFMALGVSAGGHVLVTSPEPVTVADGADVTVVELPDGEFVFDLDW